MRCMHPFYGDPYLTRNASAHAGLRVITVSRGNVMCAPPCGVNVNMRALQRNGDSNTTGATILFLSIKHPTLINCFVTPLACAFKNTAASQADSHIHLQHITTEDRSTTPFRILLSDSISPPSQPPPSCRCTGFGHDSCSARGPPEVGAFVTRAEESSWICPPAARMSRPALTAVRLERTPPTHGLESLARLLRMYHTTDWIRSLPNRRAVHTYDKIPFSQRRKPISKQDDVYSPAIKQKNTSADNNR